MIKPYVASSNAIPIAFIGIGIENKKLRNNGVIKPIRSPYFHPHTIPHSITGMCIGKSLFPISRICPVKNGRISPMAKNKAAKVNFFADFIGCLFSVRNLIICKFEFSIKKKRNTVNVTKRNKL